MPEQNISAEQADHLGEKIYTISGRGFSATCDAFVVNPLQETIWFASMIGSRRALQAISANLMALPAQRVFLNSDDPEDGYRAFLPADQNERNWTHRVQRLPNTQICHGMTYSQEAEYNGSGSRFVLISRSPLEQPGLYYRFLDHRLTIPMHPSWSQWLWETGKKLEEILPLEGHGVTANHCTVNPAYIQMRISEAIQAGELQTE